MLSSISELEFKQTKYKRRVFRLNVLLDDKIILNDADASADDAHAIKGMVDSEERYLKGFSQSERLKEAYIDFIFNPKRELEKKFPTRFSDGFPVFYSSLDERTAEAEVCYHHCKFIRGGGKTQGPERRVLLSCIFSGSVKDLRSLNCPEFFQRADDNDVYQFCQQLGREAADEGLYGLLAPSVRRPGGINLPVFCEKALSDIELRHRVDIVYDPTKKSASAIKIECPDMSN